MAYKFGFQSVGGATRVKISSGEDIKHLGELDEKMWTVLSCPTKGLQIDEKTLSYIDSNADGKIHVKEVVAASQWLCGVLKNPDILLRHPSSIALEEINRESAEGAKLYDSAVEILKNLGKEDATEVSLADTADSMAIFAKTRYNGDGIITAASVEGEEQKQLIEAILTTTEGVADRSGDMGVSADQINAFYAAVADYLAWNAAAVEAPYGEHTDKVIELYNALDKKVRDFFMRSRLAAFSSEATSALDVRVASIEAISTENLVEKCDEIANYPLARIGAEAVLNLSATINPVWADKFDALKALVFEGKEQITEADWNEVAAKLSAYIAWRDGKKGANVEALGLERLQKIADENLLPLLLEVVEKDKALEVVVNEMNTLDKLLHLCRDFYTLLRNYVTFHDFYSYNRKLKAIFQAGTLLIDQRECHLCVRVADVAKMNTMAASSGMYLVFCDCVCKQQPAKLQIVAAITQGSIGDICVGKNAIFYDRDGVDWDAVVTKIVDNPISISQAFWSPYRRVSVWVENLINKRAAEKDSKMMSEATTKLSATPDLKAQDGKAAQPAAPFDIAKFAGIFAALGMALGMIGTALVSVAKGFAALTWWQGIAVIVGLLLMISGPSMVMAWIKLRRRNVAPLLNANGWAINAPSLVNIAFGSTLTEMVRFPKIKIQEPRQSFTGSARKQFLKEFTGLIVVCALAAGGWYLWRLHTSKQAPAEQVQEELVQEADSTKLSTDTIEMQK